MNAVGVEGQKSPEELTEELNAEALALLKLMIKESCREGNLKTSELFIIWPRPTPELARDGWKMVGGFLSLDARNASDQHFKIGIMKVDSVEGNNLLTPGFYVTVTVGHSAKIAFANMPLHGHKLISDYPEILAKTCEYIQALHAHIEPPNLPSSAILGVLRALHERLSRFLTKKG